MSAQQAPQDPDDLKAAGSEFQAALRRDLASNRPVLAYEPCVGGAVKRGFDLALAVFLAPAWLAVLLLAITLAGAARRRWPLSADDRIGYGGRSFRCLRLRLSEGEDVVDLRGLVRWRRSLERLPQMLHVVSGEMALIGPKPLSRDAVAALRSARRAYMSARPSVLGLGVSEEGASDYRTYAERWSWWGDAATVLAVLSGVRRQ